MIFKFVEYYVIAIMALFLLSACCNVEEKVASAHIYHVEVLSVEKATSTWRHSAYFTYRNESGEIWNNGWSHGRTPQIGEKLWVKAGFGGEVYRTIPDPTASLKYKGEKND